MVSSPEPLSHLSNPLITSTQLQSFLSSSSSLSVSSRFCAYLLTQAAGILLRLPQPVIATAIVLLQRYLVANPTNPDTGSKASQSPLEFSSAAMYLAAKASSTPVAPRSVINVYAYLTRPETSPLDFIATKCGPPSPGPPNPTAYNVSEGEYERSRLKLYKCEALTLAGVGFDVHVALPHSLALAYLSTLGSVESRLAERVLGHLNAALLSPQLLYLTHQPNVLATAAIYLAAREVGVKLVSASNWWEVFDVDREALGFCVMAMGSLERFAEDERGKWKDKSFPLD